jgi:hypothetical protein
MHHLSYDNTEDDILWLDAAYLASMQMTHSIMRYLLGGSQDLPLLSSDLDKIVHDQESNVDHGALRIEPSK